MGPDCPVPLVDWIRFHLAFLARPDLGEELLERFGEPGLALRSVQEAPEPAPDLPPGLRASLQSARLREQAEAEVRRLAREGTGVLHRGGADWPVNLSGLPGMPLLLFGRGKLLPEDAVAVGVVGSRRPSLHGLRQAERFGAGLAAMGITVVSGLARGIDAAAHLGALGAGGRTIAVLGSGLGRIYPREHAQLASRIAGAGAVLTEFPWDAPPLQYHFPHRNRILSALSLGVLVVEAGERSGSLITAEWALEQDRPVFALPGRVDALEARGALRLIQEGARLVIEPEEIAETLGLRTAARPAAGAGALQGPDKAAAGAPATALPPELAALFAEEDSLHADRIIERLGRPPEAVLAELSRLEANGALERLPGGAYAPPTRRFR